MPDTTYNLDGGFKPTIKRSADLGGPDFFPTPAWVTFALIDNEDFNGEIWESALRRDVYIVRLAVSRRVAAFDGGARPHQCAYTAGDSRFVGFSCFSRCHC